MDQIKIKKRSIHTDLFFQPCTSGARRAASQMGVERSPQRETPITGNAYNLRRRNLGPETGAIPKRPVAHRDREGSQATLDIAAGIGILSPGTPANQIRADKVFARSVPSNLKKNSHGDRRTINDIGMDPLRIPGVQAARYVEQPPWGQQQQPSFFQGELRNYPPGPPMNASNPYFQVPGNVQYSMPLGATNNNNTLNTDVASIVTQVLNSIQNLRVMPNTSTQPGIDLNRHLPFFGNDDTVHPIDFLQQIEHFYESSQISFNDFKIAIGNQFKGKALLWSKAYLHTFHDFHSFKNSFREHFWSETKQLEIRLLLQAARFEEKTGSFVDHFMKYVAMAKHLTPEYSQNLLIQTIARHYPPNISSVLVGTQTLAEAMDRLRQADYYFRVETSVPNQKLHTRIFEDRNASYVRYSRDKSQFNKRDNNSTAANVAVVRFESELAEPDSNADFSPGNESAPHNL